MDDFIANGSINARSEEGWFPVEAYITGSLAIQDGLDEYLITHIGTGRIVLRSGPDCSFQDAIKVASDIQPLFWDMPDCDWIVGRKKPSEAFLTWLKGIEPKLRLASEALGAKPYWVR